MPPSYAYDCPATPGVATVEGHAEVDMLSLPLFERISLML